LHQQKQGLICVDQFSANAAVDA